MAETLKVFEVVLRIGNDRDTVEFTDTWQDAMAARAEFLEAYPFRQRNVKVVSHRVQPTAPAVAALLNTARVWW
jgi:hypothetical protein